MRAAGVTFRILLVVVVMLLLLIAGGWLAVRTSLPQVSGELVLGGLNGQVTVTRDDGGVPHIRAESLADAYFALGFVHAQDRLWQMEFQRRVAAGTLAEVVGEPAVDTDRFVRTLGVYRAAERAIAHLDPATLSALRSYTGGINAFLTTRRGLLPPEFLLLGHEPAPWSPADVIGWAKMMAWDLAGNWNDELYRARVASVLGPEQAAALWPEYAGGVPVTIQGSWLELSAGDPPADSGAPGTGPPEEQPQDEDEQPVTPDPDAQIALQAFDIGALLAAMPEPLPEGSGSNAWVLSGEHTASGLPLLANDPHLGLQAPSLFYLVHVEAPGLNVIGGSLPGTPAVLLGRNSEIAWGLTNTGSDVQDIFIERTLPGVAEGEPGMYLTENGFVDFQVRTEVLRVKGSPDITFTVRETRNGPVISDLVTTGGVLPDALATDGNTYVLTLRWTALDDDDRTVQAILNLNRAGSWDEAVTALEDFHNPQQNIMYADVEGNIGFIAPGRVPIRPVGDGMSPVPGWTGEHTWSGYVPFAEVPMVLNPESGILVNANQRITPDDYPHHLSSTWSVPYRADRIHELLGRAARHTVLSSIAVQGDLTSRMAREFVPLLLDLEAAPGLEARVQAGFLTWDGESSPDRAEPLVLAAWQRELQRRLLQDTLGQLFGGFAGQRPTFLLDALAGGGDWCVLASPGSSDPCREAAQAAYSAAVEWLSDEFGPDESGWRWGDAHRSTQLHGVLGRTALGPLVNLHTPTGGDAFTVNVASFRPFSEPEPFGQHHGAAYRAVMDLSDPDGGFFVHSTGQSGNPVSPAYRDLQSAWRDNRPLPMRLSQPESAVSVLRLQPAR